MTCTNTPNVTCDELVDKYIGSTYDSVKVVADNIEALVKLTELLGTGAGTLFESILFQLGHNIVGSFEGGFTLTEIGQYVTYKQETYYYNGDIYPYTVNAGTPVNSDFTKGYRGSVQDWNAFDRALLDYANIPYTSAPDDFVRQFRLDALIALGIPRAWKEGETVYTLNTLVRFEHKNFECIKAPAIMDEFPSPEYFKLVTVDPDDIVPDVAEVVKRYKEEAELARDSAIGSAASSAASASTAGIAKNEAEVARNEAVASKVAAEASELASKESETIVKAAETNVINLATQVINEATDVNTKHADVVVKHAAIVNMNDNIQVSAETMTDQLIQANIAVLDATQAKDRAETFAETAFNHSSSAQNAAVSAETAGYTATQRAIEATNSATSAEGFKQQAGNYASTAEGSMETAQASAVSAKSDADRASLAAGTIGTAVTDAKNAAKEAAKSATDAQTSANTSIAETFKAIEAKNAAISSANAAKSSENNILGMIPELESLKNDAEIAVVQAQNSAISASTSATNAANSATEVADIIPVATEAATTATNAVTLANAAASAALVSKDEAAVSATNASTDARSAANSKSAANSSAINAGNAETAAASSAANADASKTSAASSANSATASANLSTQAVADATIQAEDSANSATQSKAQVTLAQSQVSLAREEVDKAIDQVTIAQTAKEEALAARNGAEAARDKAEEWAVSDTTNNSSKYWANQAKDFATNVIQTGGAFTPTTATQYPNITGITKDTLWFVTFEDAATRFTFTTGSLNGKTVASGDTLLLDMPTKEWSIIRSQASASILTVNGQHGPHVNLNAADVEAIGKYGDQTIAGALNVSTLKTGSTHLNGDWGNFQFNLVNPTTDVTQMIVEGNPQGALNLIGRRADGNNSYAIAIPKVTGTMYTTGNKPTASDVGAASITEGMTAISRPDWDLNTFPPVGGVVRLGSVNSGSNIPKWAEYSNVINAMANRQDTMFQMIGSYKSPDLAWRGGNKGSQNLADKPWLKIYHEGFKPTATDISALDNRTTGIVGGTDLYQYFKSCPSGMYKSGSDVLNAPAGYSHGDFLVIDHGSNYRAILCLDQNNRFHTLYWNSGAHTGWASTYSTAAKPTWTDVGGNNYWEYANGNTDPTWIAPKKPIITSQAIKPYITHNKLIDLGREDSQWKTVWADSFKGATGSLTGGLRLGGLELTGASSAYGTAFTIVSDDSPTYKLQIGVGNSSYCHYQTNTVNGHWFDKAVAVRGEIFAGSTYNQRVYHQGFKPRADELDGLVTITRSLSLAADQWVDTGIVGGALPTGSYIVQLYANATIQLSLYDETFTGIMTWFATDTNSSDFCEIPTHSAGHASNTRHLYLRTVRQGRGNGGLKLQIMCNHATVSAASLVFKFRKLI